MSHSRRKKREKRKAARSNISIAKLMVKARGKCHWCNIPIIAVRNIPRGLRIKQHDGVLVYWPIKIGIGVPMTKSVATVDHIVPISDGGSNEEGNLVASCERCNASRNHSRQVGLRVIIRMLNDGDVEGAIAYANMMLGKH